MDSISVQYDNLHSDSVAHKRGIILSRKKQDLSHSLSLLQKDFFFHLCICFRYNHFHDNHSKYYVCNVIIYVVSKIKDN